ncbi:uncharacterized protein LOC112035870 [Quercus suber]|uniref:uncharacterized protein LOC112035870 n=1 Tax=Quercus suber TaxID=58331 RepID=UPI000CE2684E|nr:uncharacterized protein LOC112035870 [Quercus suber]
MVQNIQLPSSVLKIAWRESPIIGFSKEDVRRLYHPHYDALVVSIHLGNYNVHRVLVDNVSFGGTRVFPLGTVTLSVTAGDYLQQITKDVTFLVVDFLSAYNGIFGRPTLNSWKVATSMYHLMIKFSTNYGVGELEGDQVAVHECYITMLEMEDHQQTLCIEEQQITAEPVEELEEITLDESRPERTTRMGTLAS